MKIEVGIYVRYKRGSNGYGVEPPERIAKVVNRINNSDFLQLDVKQDILESDVIKADHNIIKLIKAGDYVNGAKVNRIEKDYIVINEIWTGRELLRNEDIKSIVTKEQFETIVYKVN